MYLIKSPWLLRKMFPDSVWDIPVHEDVLYLTFDDGPHPQATPFVLEQLKKYNALATFFCIGKNVQQFPEIYKRILSEGHRVGNHTQNHVNGWKVRDEMYISDVIEARKVIDSNIFRPPYGRITKFQSSVLTQRSDQKPFFKIIMWSVISADFDERISGEKCTANVVKNAKRGSIVVFHDSQKALPRLKDALPKVLQHFAERKFRFEAIKI